MAERQLSGDRNLSIEWIEVETIDSLAGHGVEFVYTDQKGSRHLVAFLDGYGWYHGTEDTATIYILSPASQSLSSWTADPAIVLDEIRAAVQKFFSNPKSQRHGELTSNVFAWFNA